MGDITSTAESLHCRCVPKLEPKLEGKANFSS